MRELLDGLRSGVPARAWAAFLEDYAPLLLGTIGQRIHGEDARADCFVYVCEAFAEDGHRRLLAFDPDGRARFTTWLTVVVARLCVDWLRQTRGRPRPFANIGLLPPLEQRLFQLRHELHLERSEILPLVLAEHPHLDGAAVQTALTRVERTLTPDQRWRLAMRRQSLASLDEVAETADEARVEDDVSSHDEQQKLDAALEQLPAEDRLLLQYRFEQDLSFDQIAQLTRLGDPFRARRAVDSALARLRRIFSKS